MPELVFPLRQRPHESYHGGGREFGARRNGGARRHAACDLIAPPGTEILAIADGTVLRGPSEFYEGTYALEVRHEGGKVARYGEIAKLVPPGIQVGATVRQGQLVARVGRLHSGSSMLHFELYDGSASGPLTQPDRPPYMRRKDLIDPTALLDAAPLVDGPAAAAAAGAEAPVPGRVGARVSTVLHLRAEPSPRAAGTFELHRGDDVVVLRALDGEVYDWDRRDWLEIEHDGRRGFVAAFYVDVGAPPAAMRAFAPVSLPPADVTDRWEWALRTAEPGGASAQTASQDRLPAGVEASRTMAAHDLPRVLAVADRFASVAGKLGIPAAVLAGLASRESRCGSALDAGGWGDRGNAFGILQVDKRHHDVQGTPDPTSAAHIEQAAGIFAQNLAEIVRRHPDWADPFVLEGAAVAYNSGVRNVVTLQRMNVGTTGNDYGADVLARSQFYLYHPRLPLFRSAAPIAA
jgi:hypothetical protein